MIDNLVTIYEKNDGDNISKKVYSTQGLGVLSDWFTAEVNSKLNGAEIFEGAYPLNGVNADLIQEERIIQCYVDENREKQRLRIYYAKTSVVDNRIEVKAEPIFNDIRKSVIKKYDSGTSKITASVAWENAKKLAKPAIPSQFNFSSLVDTNAAVKIEKANFLEFFGGKEGSILDRFHGEFQKNNNSLNHVKRLGTDHKIKAIYTKNLTGLDLEIDSQSVLVGVYPYISGSNDEENEIVLPEEIILTEYAEEFPSGYISFVDFKDEATDVATLRTAASSWLKSNVDKQQPQVSGAIELVSLRHQKGYEKFIDLEKVSMGDGIDVYHPQLKIDMSARIVEYTFNVLTNTYEKLVVGNVKTNFLENTENKIGDLINDALKNLPDENSISDLINEIVDHQTDLITGQDGGYVVLDPKESPSRILVMDSPDKTNAKNVIQINNAGIGFSKNGISGPYETAWTIDGTFNAKFITSGVLKAISIEGVTIQGSIVTSRGEDFTTEISNGEIKWSRNDTDEEFFTFKAGSKNSISGILGDTILIKTKNNSQHVMIGQSMDILHNPNSYLALSEGYLRVELSDAQNNIIDKGGSFSVNSYPPKVSQANYSISKPQGKGKLYLDGDLGWAQLGITSGTDIAWGGGISVGETYTAIDHRNNKGGSSGEYAEIKLINTGQMILSAPKKGVTVQDDFRVNGTKNATVRTDDYGMRDLSAIESPEIWFVDYGEAVTGDDGKAQVNIDPIFAQTIVTSRYLVYVTPTELTLCAVTHEDTDHFIIETEKPNVLVRYQLVAHRLDYQNIRLNKFSENGYFEREEEERLPDEWIQKAREADKAKFNRDVEEAYVRNGNIFAL